MHCSFILSFPLQKNNNYYCICKQSQYQLIISIIFFCLYVSLSLFASVCFFFCLSLCPGSRAELTPEEKEKRKQWEKLVDILENDRNNCNHFVASFLCLRNTFNWYIIVVQCLVNLEV